MYRMTTCEITYGPLSCDFVFRGSNECAQTLPLRPMPWNQATPWLYGSEAMKLNLLRFRI